MRASTHPIALAVAATVAVVATVGVVTAATTTTVEVTPGEQAIQEDDRATFDVVVTAADRGVGAYNLSVSLGTPSAASIEDVSIPGEPAISDVRYTDGRERVQLRVVGLDTPDAGRVTAATVTLVPTTSDGTSAVHVDVRALGDEDGNSYTVAGTDAGTLVVGTAGDGQSPESTTPAPTPSPTATTTPTATPTATPPPTATPTATTTPTATPTPTVPTTVTPTPPPAATPTATSATSPTATEVTATPTATMTPGSSGPGFGLVGMLLSLVLVVHRTRRR